MDKIKSYKASVSIIYNPETYIEYCNEDDVTPTQEGFLKFIEDWIDDDFGSNIAKVEMIK